MRFLVTNDDGIASPGLAAIVEVLQQYGEVNVVCPNKDKSAVGHSITFRNSLEVQESNLFGEYVKTWTVNGTPADCVKIALEVLVPGEIDFVVSGMNIGANIGRDSYYSGTIAGAREASFFGIPAVAVSLDVLGVQLPDFSSSKKLFSNAMATILTKPFDPNLLLNINIPYVEASQCKGIKFAELDYKIHRYKHVEMRDPSELVVYWLKENEVSHETDNPFSDFALLQEGYMTVTPLQVQLTDQSGKSEIENWFEESLVPAEGSLL